MNHSQNELATDTANISPFLEYIDSILKELIEAGTSIHLEQGDLIEFISSTQTLQDFVHQCSSTNASLRLDVLHAVIKIDSELYSDLLLPALLRRLPAYTLN